MRHVVVRATRATGDGRRTEIDTRGALGWLAGRCKGCNISDYLLYCFVSVLNKMLKEMLLAE